MRRVLLTEAIILIGCLSLFPAVLVVVFSQTESVGGALQILAKGLFSSSIGHGPMTIAALWLKVIAPYLLIQTWRAYSWSRSGSTGRKWANLYFAFMGALASVWFFLQTWDMLTFMYGLGDLPAELAVFLRLEGTNTSLSVLCAGLSIYCFTVFLGCLRRRP
jgi:hypothetical protein